jgi:hypothetical protein
MAMYMMEVTAMPFALREFMVKCWSRHRDTPKKMDDLTTMAFDLLQKMKEDLLERMKSRNIKVEKLEKVVSLLSDIDITFQDIAAEKMDEGLTAVQARVKAAKEADCDEMRKLTTTAERRRDLLKNGHISTVNFKWVSAEALELRHKALKKTKKNPPAAATPETSNPAADFGIPESPCPAAAASPEIFNPAADVGIPDFPCPSSAAANQDMLNPPAAATPETSNPAAEVDIPDSSVIEAAPVVDAPSDQPSKSPKGVHLGIVQFREGVVAELRAVLNLRPCNTHLDGFCGTRVAASLRNTTMEELVQDLEHFWDYDGHANAPPGTITTARWRY